MTQIIIPEKLTKAAIQQAGEMYATQLLDAGDESPLKALIKLRALHDAVGAAIKELQDAATEEAERYGRDDSVLYGVKFQVRGGSTRYDYSHDPVWAEIKASETAVADQRKAREAFLKTLQKDMVDPDTGEFISPAKVSSVGNGALALTFPKE
jgi:uncharacterized protein involved in exopolysaccharide biosynthesis